MGTVKRGGQGVRRSAAARGRAGRAHAARAQTRSALGAALAYLPFTERQLQRVFLALILAAALTFAWFIASLAGLPALAGERFAAATANAGFAVKRVTVTGVERMDEQSVYQHALDERDRPIASLDMEGLRQELLELPWVADARVSRRLPDHIAIDIVERKPHAALAKADGWMLIDRTGRELQPISRTEAQDMLLVKGPGAARQVAELDRLLDMAPALKPKVREAEWIGNRRWNLTFDTGQVLALPQDENRAAGALVRFARLDGTNRLLGGKVASFDMRSPDRIYMRIPGRADGEPLALKEGGQP
ncbi:cell division protein FtsQ/DivIB [Porphyrobacter sp. GA68]|uniref:cell division protein FtsQ/DivIB n=1 Tax=Porphyrobacter sp. GA68 TaxID=2883480 RepID=UPI001D1956A4|nr:FtsQ-type POTRA domain-containing protein [Porphyrobacter sp. GA68]